MTPCPRSGVKARVDHASKPTRSSPPGSTGHTEAAPTTTVCGVASPCALDKPVYISVREIIRSGSRSTWSQRCGQDSRRGVSQVRSRVWMTIRCRNLHHLPPGARLTSMTPTAPSTSSCLQVHSISGRTGYRRAGRIVGLAELVSQRAVNPRTRADRRSPRLRC